jgi:hypothetical protein
MYQFGKVGNTNIDYQNATVLILLTLGNCPALYFAFERDNGEFSGYTRFWKRRKVDWSFGTSQIDWEAMYVLIRIQW